MREIAERLHEKKQIELAKSILENAGYTVNESTESGHKFKVGDTVEWSGLYGGSYTGKIKDITDDKITLTVSWTSEDDGKLVQKDSTYDLEKDEEGNDVFIVWEYHGHKGYVYPPSMDESKKLTEDAFDYDEESEGDQSLFDIISTQLVDTMFPDTQFDMKEMEKIDKAVHLLIWVRKHLESRDAI